MSKKTRRTRRMRNMLLVVSMMLVVAMASVGVTVAWLTDKTDEIVNTFTTSDISIELAETTTNYKMIPGNEIAKDPKVTVKAGSEACYVFVEITKSANYDTYLMPYSVAEGWEPLNDADLPANTAVYYREQAELTAADAADASYYVLADGQTDATANGHVQVKDNVTKELMEAVKDSNKPTLTFKAYACQSANVAGPLVAWNTVSASANTNAQ